MKLRMLCAFLSAMLLVSAASFGEILESGTGTSSNVAASASYGNEYEADSDSKWYYYYTTEAGDFDWYIDLYTEAKCKTQKFSGWVGAEAVADADGNAETKSQTIYASAFATVTREFDTGGIWAIVIDKDYKSGSSVEFSAYTGVYAELDVSAVAEVEEGSTSLANAYADALAYPSMSIP